jgi:hypothetical protein
MKSEMWDNKSQEKILNLISLIPDLTCKTAE